MHLRIFCRSNNNRILLLILLLLGSLSFISCSESQKNEVDGATNNATYVEVHFSKEEVTIEMRDGIKLHTTIYSPKDTSKAYPILLKRTPYSCKPYGANEYPANIGPNKYMMKQGYIVVYQDVRGRWMSEGTYDNMRAYIPNKQSEKDIDEARRSSTRKLFAQEYECDWTTTELQVYELNEEKHLIDLSHVQARDRRFDFIAGLDVGYRDENVFVVIATDGDEFFLVDEYVSNETTTSTLAEEIQEKIDEWGIDTIYIDSAAQQLKADLAYDYDIYCENAIKSVNDGIAAVQVLIENDNLLVDVNKCGHTYSSLSSYKWNPKTENPKPVHDWASHASDAVRYAIYTHQKRSVGIFAAA